MSSMISSKGSIFHRIEIPNEIRELHAHESIDTNRFSHDPSSSATDLTIQDRKPINLDQFVSRHPADEKFVQIQYNEMALLEEMEQVKYEKHKNNDDADLVDITPSYTKFKIPFEIVSRQRYIASKAKYEEQFRREINELIDYQASALEASYFVRIMSYTTFWPPLHNRHELGHTSKTFFQLTPKEKWRLQFIMSNNFT